MKAGFVGILGVTNAGKSTIINNILGEELSIATPVVQTTRDLIKGIYKKLEPFRDRRAGKLSGGMNQKLALS